MQQHTRGGYSGSSDGGGGGGGIRRELCGPSVELVHWVFRALYPPELLNLTEVRLETRLGRSPNSAEVRDVRLVGLVAEEAIVPTD
jgi:hypothetical protein